VIGNLYRLIGENHQSQIANSQSLHPLWWRKIFFQLHPAGLPEYHLLRQADDARRCGFGSYTARMNIGNQVAV
jgi:hypothetical protein